MASPGKTTAGIGGGGRPHFFKIILDNAIRDGKLFAKLYGGDLQDSAVLRDPSGTEWTVELTESDGEVWLQKGFREFADFYSLSHGYLVVFELVDRWISRFNVVVFDPTATEIEYPSPPPPLAAPSSKMVLKSSPVHEGVVSSDSDEWEPGDDDDDDSSVEILDAFPSLPGKSRGDEDFGSNCWNDENVGIWKKTEAVMGLDAGDQWKKRKRTSPPPPSSKLCTSAPAKTLRGFGLNEKAEAIDRARAAFTSQNPHFMVVVHPSHIHPATAMAIPMNFARDHLKVGGGDAILSKEYNAGRRWKVKYMVKANPETSRILMATFRCGWKEFAGANQLSVGDVCAFELMKSSRDAAVHTFRVTIFRTDQKVW